MGKKVECPSCYFEFEADDDVMVGEVITCPDCGADLEVVAIEGDKIELKTAEMSEEDWGE